MPVGRRLRSELPTDDAGRELVKLWRGWLDPQQTPVSTFLALYKVPTKRVVGIGQSSLVRFAEYPFQAEFGKVMDDQWASGEGAKVLGLKGRQEGMTKYMNLRAWERFVRGGGGTGNYYSYDDPHSMEAFAFFLSLKRQTPPWVFEHLMHETREGSGWKSGGGVWTKKSARQLQLSFPGGVDHLLQCATAGGRASGSGSAPRWIYLDEFTKYPAKVKADYTGISEGWADSPGNIFALWGTGQGREKYAELFTEHYGKETTDKYVAYFRSWLGHPDRRWPFKTTREMEEFVSSVGRLKEFGIEEEIALLQAGATHEELNWRRRKIADPSFNFDLALFAREFPLTVIDAFRSESGAVFDIDTLEKHERLARDRERASTRGEFREVGDDVVFEERRDGRWTIYEQPQPDGWYCFGADSASGKAIYGGAARAEADWSVADYAEVYTGRTVAKFRARVEGGLYGAQLVLASRYYRNVEKNVPARGYPETNHESSRAAMDRIRIALEESGGDILDMVLLQDGMVGADGKVGPPNVGWYTSGVAVGGATAGSRGVLVDQMKTYIAEIGEPKAVDGREPTTPYTLGFIMEAYRFERNMKKKGRPEAASGHDDEVFARMLAICARRRLIDEGDVPLNSKAQLRDPDGPIEAFWKRVISGQKKQKHETTVASVLGRGFLLLTCATLLEVLQPLV